MAQYMQTDEGSGEDNELKKWISKHKLSSAKQKLIENNVELEELAELDPVDAKEYAKNVLGLNAIESIRFVKAVKSLSNSPNIKQNIPTTSPSHIVRVVLSELEDEAINKLIIQKREINANINNRLNDIKILKKAAEFNENAINNLRKEFIDKLNESMDQLIKQSNDEIHKKHDLLSNHIETLQKYEQMLSSANSQITALLNDSNMDKIKRKTKLITISNQALNTEFEDIDILHKVEVEVNKNEVLNYLNNIGTINNFTFPDTPKISMTDIKATSATVLFNNIKTYECVVELDKNYQVGNNEEYDEKKSNWKQICSVQNKDHYKITNLDSCTYHIIRAKYKDSRGFGKFCCPISFKTKRSIIYTSSILTSTEIKTFLSLLSSNGKDLGDKQWNLIYRGQTDGINSRAFGNKCYNIGNLMVIIHNSNNNVFGGYTSSGWNTSSQFTKDEKAFLFSIRSSKNYSPAIANIKSEKAIYAMQFVGNDTTSNYCMWGCGTDVWINGKENTVRANDPSTFHPFPQSGHYQSGGVYQTNINDIEVFQLL